MKLKSVSLEFEDGTTRTLNSSDLNPKVGAALTEAGLCEPASGIVSAKHYLILEWKDGWREVLAINSQIADVIRYFVIRRIEDRGRLALDVGADYPELLIIERCPAELARIFISGESGARSVELNSEVESYEGIFESGGKKEYKKYDRGLPAFKDKLAAPADGQNGIEKTVVESVKRAGLDARKLLAMDENARIQEYRKIAKGAGLQGLKQQSDVYGLIESVLKNRFGAKTSTSPRG